MSSTTMQGEGRWYGMFAMCARENWLASAKKIFFNA